MKCCGRREQSAGVLSMGDDESSMSVEQRGDRDDVSTLGKNEDWTMS